jgi:RHS repeat-associated protein
MYQSATYTVPMGAAYVALYAQDYLPSASTTIWVDDGFLYDGRIGLTLVDGMDYLPFGEQITGGTGSTHKFTGKERDSESGLDNFGARYDSSQYGRFMTPDWSAKPTSVPYAVFNNPQSLNLYAYVQNNPVTNRDPDGHWCLFGKWGSTCTPPPPPPPPVPPKPPQFVRDNPTFRTVNQAGTAAARKDQQGQQQTGAEHGNNVFGEPGAYTYTDPVTQGQHLTVDQNNTTGVSHTKPVDLRKAPIPPGTDLVGEAHSHPENIGFSPEDAQRAHDQTIPSMGHPRYEGMYLGLPNSNVVKYDPRTGEQTTFGPGE